MRLLEANWPQDVRLYEGERNFIKILKNISMTMKTEYHIEKEIRVLQIMWTSVLREYPIFYTWLENIQNLSDWMKVDISKCCHEGDNCYINISF